MDPHDVEVRAVLQREYRRLRELSATMSAEDWSGRPEADRLDALYDALYYPEAFDERVLTEPIFDARGREIGRRLIEEINLAKWGR